MMRSRFVFVFTLSAVLTAPRLQAQSTLNGSAEVSVARSETRVGEQHDANGAIGQNYSVGWGSTLFDPRLFRYQLQTTYRTSDFSASSTGRADQGGRAGDFGYKVGATVLPASAMPFTFQTSRTRSTSTGDLAPSNPIRSGLVAASGAPPADYESLNRETSLGWTIGLERMPQVTLGYRAADALISGGQYQATQKDRDLSASVLKNTKATHQMFRYQATRSENVMEQTFAQRLGLIDYDFGASLTTHTRIGVNAGRRSTYARSVFARAVDAAAGAYVPPSTSGQSSSEYGQVNMNYDPHPRFSLRMTGSADRQAGDSASTASVLGSLASHAEVLKGLIINASGTTGQRQQVVAGDVVNVATRTADAGVAYQVNAKWLGAGASATRGFGINVTPDGRSGSAESWTKEAHLSTTIAWFGAGFGYDRALYRDDLLDFGNYQAERLRASAQAQTPRVALTANAEQLDVVRGRGVTFLSNLQQTISGTASLRMTGQTFISATAGQFYNNYESAAGPGVDRSLFWSVGLDGTIRQSLRLSAWLRAENADASRAQFTQDALSAFGRLEYRLRTLNFALEFRRSQSRMQYPGMLGPDGFAGRQIRFSVIRQFGMRVR